MKRIFKLGFITLVSCLLVASCDGSRIKVNVVDESGAPVENAEIMLFYVNFRDKEEKFLKTDSEGIAEHDGDAELRVNLYVSKEGYYETAFSKMNGTSLAKDVNHDLTVILRKKVSPIPLFARNIEVVMPELLTKCGFDITANDWVKPFGLGEHLDFVFTAEKKVTDPSDFETEVKLSFSNGYEGVQIDSVALRGGSFFESSFSSSRNGKLSGYLKDYYFVRKKTSDRGREGSTEKQPFLFRTRAKLDRNGELLTAHYGKIKDGIDVSKGAALEGKMPVLRFTVYFNPVPNERNLEFDPNQNLFGDLSRDQKVLLP